MYLLYVDESGDCGLEDSPTEYFILSGLVVHELRWKEVLEELVEFRRRMRAAFGLKLRDEIHASDFINGRSELSSPLKRNDRLTIIRAFADTIASLSCVSIINVVVRKSDSVGKDVFELAWTAMVQRFENTITNRNFPGPANPDDRGLILCDHTDDQKLRTLMRRLRYYNPIPHMSGSGHGGGYRAMPLIKIVEDPSFRDSRHSYFVQAADTAAYLLKQYYRPCEYMIRKGARGYFSRLEPVLCKVASSRNELGVVEL
jgi:hypothetical protein